MGIALLNGELVIKKGIAQRCESSSIRRGELMLTNRRLLFLCTARDGRPQCMSIDLGDITGMDRATVCALYCPIPLPMAFQVETRRGRTEKFLVLHRIRWMATLLEAMVQPQPFSIMGWPGEDDIPSPPPSEDDGFTLTDFSRQIEIICESTLSQAVLYSSLGDMHNRRRKHHRRLTARKPYDYKRQSG